MHFIAAWYEGSLLQVRPSDKTAVDRALAGLQESCCRFGEAERESFTTALSDNNNQNTEEYNRACKSKFELGMR